MMRLEPKTTEIGDFRETYSQDAAAGRQRRLQDYLDLFPGEELEVAAAYLELEGRRRAARRPDRSHPAEHADVIGPYELVRELGRGGQGRVYLARDRRLNREVALKVLDLSARDVRETLLRFRREAEVTSGLDHGGICPIFEAGCVGETAYIAMRYVRGQTLRQRLDGHADEESSDTSTFFDFTDETRVEAHERTRPRRTTGRREVMTFVHLIEKAARALHTAHAANIVHRDIKPGNIIVTDGNEPVILDFGLARRLGDEVHDLTQPGELYGTPAYMAPEQITSHGEIVDARSDVYSLAATLYEAVTGRRPFEAVTRADLYRHITSYAPASPRTINASIPADLATVILTALAKSPALRYDTALDFAEDLRRVRESEPIFARPAGRLRRAAYWCHRKPGLAASLATLFFVLVGSLALTGWFLRKEANHAHDLAGALARTQEERDAKEDAIAALREEREAKEAFFDLVVELLSREVPDDTAGLLASKGVASKGVPPSVPFLPSPADGAPAPRSAELYLLRTESLNYEMAETVEAGPTAGAPQAGPALREAQTLLAQRDAKGAIEQLEEMSAQCTPPQERIRVFLLGRAYAQLGQAQKIRQLELLVQRLTVVRPQPE